MSRRDDRTSLNDMLTHAREAVALVEGVSHDAFIADRVRQLALTRLLEIIGEAANRVSAPLRRSCPDVPWAQIIAMRNRLIHGYDVVDWDLVWGSVVHDLPPLITALECVLARRE